MNLKADTEYIFKTGNTISDDGTIPLKQMQEIVRCKDCKYFDGEPGQPNIQCSQMHEDDFCSYGERKGGDE